jgi:hypothetical protein
MKNRLVKGPGHVDLYGFDSYPQSLDWDACGAQEWRPVDERYYDYFESTSGEVGVPFYIVSTAAPRLQSARDTLCFRAQPCYGAGDAEIQPEFQGGTINQWTMPIAEDCQRLFGAEFERVFYLHNLASGVKMHNVYMVYGGESRMRKPLLHTRDGYTDSLDFENRHELGRVGFPAEYDYVRLLCGYQGG